MTRPLTGAFIYEDGYWYVDGWNALRFRRTCISAMSPFSWNGLRDARSRRADWTRENVEFYHPSREDSRAVVVSPYSMTMTNKLYSHQEEALRLLHSAKSWSRCRLGKSRVGASWALSKATQRRSSCITTARKRDSFEWEGEFAALGANCDEVTIESWNNVSKFAGYHKPCVIFDEQRC